MHILTIINIRDRVIHCRGLRLTRCPKKFWSVPNAPKERANRGPLNESSLLFSLLSGPLFSLLSAPKLPKASGEDHIPYQSGTLRRKYMGLLKELTLIMQWQYFDLCLSDQHSYTT